MVRPSLRRAASCACAWAFTTSFRGDEANRFSGAATGMTVAPSLRSVSGCVASVGITLLSSDSARPTATALPPIFPFRPCPVTLVKSATSANARPFSLAAVSMAWARGWALKCSRAAAVASTSSSRESPTARTATSLGLPSVIVPVLSMTRRSAAARISSAVGVAHENAGPGAFADGHHHRHRRRQAERTRARDDEHGNRCDETVIEGGSRTDEPPDGKSERGNGDDGRHEPCGDGIGQCLGRRPAALGFPNQRDDLGQHRVGTDPCRTHHEHALAVERPAGHGCAHRFLDRQRFACQHRFVDRAFALDDFAIGGHRFTRAHDEDVADLYMRQRHVLGSLRRAPAHEWV